MILPVELRGPFRPFRMKTRTFILVRQQRCQRTSDFVNGCRIELDGRIAANLPKAGCI